MSSKDGITPELIAEQVAALRAEIASREAEIESLQEQLNWWLRGRQFFDDEGRSPVEQSKTGSNGKPTLRRAIMAIMEQKPTATWATAVVLSELAARDWMPSGKNAEHHARSMLAEMARKKELRRTGRGRYRLPPDRQKEMTTEDS